MIYLYDFVFWISTGLQIHQHNIKMAMDIAFFHNNIFNGCLKKHGES